MAIEPTPPAHTAGKQALPAFHEFPLVVKGRAYEDFAVGDFFEHHWGRTVTEADNVQFCTATCNWNPMGLNIEYARAHGHPSVVINSMLVACIAFGLSVEDLSEGGGAFLGMETCEFHRPVYAGDTLRSSSTVLDKRLSESRPDAGIVTWKTEGRNQRGEIVVTFVRSNLITKRHV